MAKHIHNFGLMLLAGTAWLGQSAPIHGQGNKGDEQAIRQAAEGYSAAYNKGDVAAIMAYWAADAEYVDEAGKATRGRQAIAAMLKKSLDSHKGQRLKLNVQGLRFLKAEVALEDGAATLTHANGATESNRYLVVWVKSDGQWLISSVRDLAGDAAEAGPYPRLKQLEWLIGDWEFAGKDIHVRLSCRWAENQSFLLQEYTIQHADKSFTMSQRIGWDPVRGQIRSWFFDAKGGFGEGFWSRDGNRWIVDVAGVLPDGRTGSSRNVWKFVDAQTIVWHSRNREVDQRPLADAETRLTRKTVKP